MVVCLDCKGLIEHVRRWRADDEEGLQCLRELDSLCGAARSVTLVHLRGHTDCSAHERCHRGANRARAERQHELPDGPTRVSISAAKSRTQRALDEGTQQEIEGLRWNSPSAANWWRMTEGGRRKIALKGDYPRYLEKILHCLLLGRVTWPLQKTNSWEKEEVCPSCGGEIGRENLCMHILYGCRNDASVLDRERWNAEIWTERLQRHQHAIEKHDERCRAIQEFGSNALPPAPPPPTRESLWEIPEHELWTTFRAQSMAFLERIARRALGKPMDPSAEERDDTEGLLWEAEKRISAKHRIGARDEEDLRSLDGAELLWEALEEADLPIEEGNL